MRTVKAILGAILLCAAGGPFTSRGRVADLFAAAAQERAPTKAVLDDRSPDRREADPHDAEDHGAVRFEAVDVFVDSADKPLAVYQVEVTAKSGNVLLAGLEGGDAAAFRSAPYYDPRALLGNKVVVAAFSTAADLPRGRTHVARLMVQVSGPAEPQYDATLTVAASADGKPVAAEVRAVRLAAVDVRHAASSPSSPSTSPTSNPSDSSEGAVP